MTKFKGVHAPPALFIAGSCRNAFSLYCPITSLKVTGTLRDCKVIQTLSLNVYFAPGGQQ